MAFVCPPKENCDRRKDLLANLKMVVEQIAEEQKQIPCHSSPLPSCEPTPSCCPPCVTEPPKPPASMKLPEMMVCYRVQKTGSKAAGDATFKANAAKRLKQSKSRELRCGRLYVGCDCEKRNGLQDDCQRSECHGSPECLTRPPTCGPSEFSNGKHLGKSEYGRAGGMSNGFGGTNSGYDECVEEYLCYPAFLDAKDVCPAF